MKIINKFKKYSRDIKLIIITTLIVSCVGVYAAGECIISATADDVTYGDTTVQDAIDELYSMAQDYCPVGYTCTRNNPTTDCDNNQNYTTIPWRLTGLAKIMAKDAYLDNGQSEYVSSCNGVDFSNISSNTNGKGIYEMASTKNDAYPIYYYRGAVTNNNVKFGGFCWKAIRTTNTGGVKMIYNGLPNGSGNCTNTTGESTQIGTTYYATGIQPNHPSRIGYKYKDEYWVYYKSPSDLSGTIPRYIYGNDATYSNGIYTLTNTIAGSGSWATDNSILNNYHYTCWSTSNTCESVSYITRTKTEEAWYIPMENGKKIADMIDSAFNDNDINTTDALIKEVIDEWYLDNLVSYTSNIEDTVYCNDRSISELNGWDPNGGDVSKSLYFSPRNRTFVTHAPSLECRKLDKFTVSNSIGNGALTYPTGLITSDEIMLAGGKGDTDNNTYYLYTNQTYWSGSPRNVSTGWVGVFGVSSTGALNYNDISNYDYDEQTGDIGDGDPPAGVRPVISLSPSAFVSDDGDGTPTNPYVVQTN